MDSLREALPEILYHSYIVEGDPTSVPFVVREVLELRGEIYSQSPDVLVQIYDSLAISDSIVIKEWHSKKGITDTKKVCIIGAKFINREAEQSLLKILEEPYENTHFFLIVPNAGVLLPTIRSRMHTISVEVDRDAGSSKQGKSFISLAPQERIAYVEALIKESKDTDGSGGLRFKAIELVNSIEEVLYQKFSKSPNDEDMRFVLGELQKAREYLSSSGASVKMILEHISLII